MSFAILKFGTGVNLKLESVKLNNKQTAGLARPAKYAFTKIIIVLEDKKKISRKKKCCQ